MRGSRPMCRQRSYAKSDTISFIDTAGTKEAADHPSPPADLGLQMHYIGGRFRPSASGATFESLNPATNEVLALAADGDVPDVEAAVAAARDAFDEGPWPGMKASERAAVLGRIGQAIRDHAEEFISREVADIGMPIAQMRGLAARAAQNFDYYAGVIRELHGRAFQ